MGISYVQESLDSQLRLPLKQVNVSRILLQRQESDDSALTRVPSTGCLKRSPSDRSLKRRVVFDLDKNFEVPSCGTIDEGGEESQSTWMTDAELKQIHRDVKAVGKHHKQNRPEFIEAYKQVWDLCAITPKDHTRSADSMARSQAIVKNLAQEASRGCEAACSSLQKKHRAEHSRKVLRTQQQLRENKEGITVQFREKILATRSMQSSRQSKLFARAFGEADAVAGASIYII